MHAHQIAALLDWRAANPLRGVIAVAAVTGAYALRKLRGR